MYAARVTTLAATGWRSAAHGLLDPFRSFSATTAPMTASPIGSRHTILCYLYPGGEIGKKNPRIVGCAENALGLREWLAEQKNPWRDHCDLVVTSDGREFDAHLPSATVVISQPFYPAYLTRTRLARAPRLQLAITAGVGSDHVDLAAAIDRNLTVAEIAGSNVVSVAEHVVLEILALVRNFVAGYENAVF